MRAMPIEWPPIRAPRVRFFLDPNSDPVLVTPHVVEGGLDDVKRMVESAPVLRERVLWSADQLAFRITDGHGLRTLVDWLHVRGYRLELPRRGRRPGNV